MTEVARRARRASPRPAAALLPHARVVRRCRGHRAGRAAQRVEGARAIRRQRRRMKHWLMRIAARTAVSTSSRVVGGAACRSSTARRRCRPRNIEQLEAADCVAPAPDDQLFAAPDRVLEARESVALAFIALLQRLPPKPRAALLLKDVVGWPAEEIADALELSLAATNSALHRAREAMAAMTPRAPGGEAAPDVVRAYIRSWEARHLDALVAMLHDEVTLASRRTRPGSTARRSAHSSARRGSHRLLGPRHAARRDTGERSARARVLRRHRRRLRAPLDAARHVRRRSRHRDRAVHRRRLRARVRRARARLV